MSITCALNRLSSCLLICITLLTPFSMGVAFPFFLAHNKSTKQTSISSTAPDAPPALTVGLTTYQYNDHDNQEAITTESSSFATNQQLGKPESQTLTSDNFTGQILQQKDSYGIPIYYTNDALGRKLTIDYGKDNHGEEIKQTIGYQQKANGQYQQTVTQPNGYQIRRIFDSLGRNIKTLDNLVSNTKVAANNFTHVLSSTSYIDLGQIQQKINKQADTVILSYNAFGNIIQSKRIAPDGLTQLNNTVKEYDYINNTVTSYAQCIDSDATRICSAPSVQVLNDSGEITSTNFMSSFRKNGVTTNNKIGINTLYDNFGDTIGHESTNTLAENRHKMTSTTTTTHYLADISNDAMGQQRQIVLRTDANGDSVEKPITITLTHDQNGVVTHKTLQQTGQSPIDRYLLLYDQSKHLLSHRLNGDSSNPATPSIEKNMTYDGNGNLVSVSNWALSGKQKQIFHMQYASILGRSKVVCTDVAKERTTKGDLNAYSIHNVYDLHTGLLTKEYFSSATCNAPSGKAVMSNVIDYQYSPDGLLLKKTYEPNNTDVINQVNQQAESIEEVYDLKSRKLIERKGIMDKNGIRDVSIYHTDSSGGRLGEVILKEIDKNNQPIANAPIANVVYHYDDPLIANYTDATYWQSNGKNKRFVAETKYTYNEQTDPRAQLIEIKHTGAPNDAMGMLYDDIKLQYKADGNLYNKTVCEANFVNYQNTYIYSEISQHLTAVIHNNYLLGSKITTQTDHVTNYTYDTNSNLTSKTISYRQNGINSPNNVVTSYAHNAYDQLTQITQQGVMKIKPQYDINGNMTIDDEGSTQAYNQENQLISYQASDKKMPATIFSYYPDGDRKSYTYTDKNHKQRTLTFYTLAGQVVNEQDEAGNTASYLMGGRQIEARMTKIGSDIQIKFYGHDQQGSVISGIIADNQEGKLKHNHLDYDAYGNDIEQSSNLSDQDATIAYDGFKYTGEYTDPKIVDGGLQFRRARYYNAKYSCFLSRDSCVFANEDTYVQGNPERSGDPSGHYTQFFGAAVSLACVTGISLLVGGGLGLLALARETETAATFAGETETQVPIAKRFERMEAIYTEKKFAATMREEKFAATMREEKFAATMREEKFAATMGEEGTSKELPTVRPVERKIVDKIRIQGSPLARGTALDAQKMYTTLHYFSTLTNAELVFEDGTAFSISRDEIFQYAKQETLLDFKASKTEYTDIARNIVKQSSNYNEYTKNWVDAIKKLELPTTTPTAPLS